MPEPPTMLQALKFVAGAVSRKDFVPAMSHFCIEDGTVRSYNGVMALSSPLPTTLACVPKAVPLIKAIEMCTAQEELQLSLTPAKRLRVKNGKFTAYIDCLPDENIPHMKPAGNFIKVDGEKWIEAFRTLFPFIGEDASRPWSNGILLRNQSAYATNNVIVIENWLGEDLPISVNIPQMAIKEVLRIGEPITYLQVDQSSISFHYDKGKWLRTQLLTTEWPPLEKILDRPSTPKPINERIFEGLALLEPFTDDAGRVFFEEGIMRTHPGDGQGASFEIGDLSLGGCYQAKLLKLIEPVVRAIDFSTYPQPCMFFGDSIRGAMSTMALPGVYAPRPVKAKDPEVHAR
jgi:hypothetical protein